MADVTADQISQARAAGYSDDEIVSHLASKSPEKFKAAKDAGYSAGEILSHFGGAKTAPQPTTASPEEDTSIAQDLSSGVKHGFKEAFRGGASTLKNIAGVDVGDADKADPNYKPANVTNGSWNPLKWNPRQIGKLIAEQSPMAAASMLSAEAGAGLGAGAGTAVFPGVGSAAGGVIGGTIGAATPYAIQMMGDAAKNRAVNRTGSPDAVPSTSDKIIGGGTAVGSAMLSGLMHTPVAAPFGTAAAGLRGLGNVVSNLGARTAVGAAGGVAQNAVSQAGEKIGTDAPFDPASLPEAAVGGAASITPHILPAVAAGARALRMGKYAADPEAAANYATRLQNTGLDLANIHEAAQAHQKVMADTHGELKAALDKVAQQKALSPEETNAVAAIRRGDQITPKDMEHLTTATANTPDGANAHFLARALKTGQLAEGEGSYSADNGWQGSATGGMKNVVRGVFNPWHIGGTMAGLGALAIGMPHVSGTVGLGMMGGLAGGLGGARLLDSITGGSRPGQNFVKTFADHNAQLRQSTAQPPAQPPPIPQMQPTPGPWGPKPLAQQSVPQVASPGAPPAPAPQLNPIAMSMLKKQLAKPLPGNPEPAPEAPQLPTFNPIALDMLHEKLKNSVKQSDADYKAQRLQAESENKTINADFNANQVHAISVNKARDQAASEADALATAALKQPKVTITKSKGGEVNATDPYAEAGSFQPVPNERKVYQGLTPEQIGDKVARERPELPEMNRMGLRNAVTQTHAARDAVRADLANQLPQHAELLHELGSQLKEPGNSDIQYSRRAIKHYTDQMDPVSSHVVRERYKRERENLWPTSAEKRAAARMNKAKAKKED